jgi:hypothetical protein
MTASFPVIGGTPRPPNAVVLLAAGILAASSSSLHCHTLAFRVGMESSHHTDSKDNGSSGTNFNSGTNRLSTTSPGRKESASTSDDHNDSQTHGVSEHNSHQGLDQQLPTSEQQLLISRKQLNQRLIQHHEMEAAERGRKKKLNTLARRMDELVQEVRKCYRCGKG